MPLRPIKPTRSPASKEKAVFASKSTWPKASFASVSTIKAMAHYRRFTKSSAKASATLMPSTPADKIPPA